MRQATAETTEEKAADAELKTRTPHRDVGELYVVYVSKQVYMSCNDIYSEPDGHLGALPYAA